MPNIIIAVAIALGTGVILFLLANGLGLPTELAKGVAGIPALAIQKTYEMLEARSAKRALAKARLGPKITMSEFSIHPISAFLFSFIAWSGAIFFTGALIGFLLGWAQGIANIESERLPLFLGVAVVLCSVPLRIIAAAYIGRWIGARSPPYVLAIVVLALILGSFATFFASSLMPGRNELESVSGYETTLNRFISVLIDLVYYILFAALGFWFGQRQRPAYYMAFLLRVFPQETKKTIMEIAQYGPKERSAAGTGAAAKAAEAQDLPV